jgi:hypothetical protein
VGEGFKTIADAGNFWVGLGGDLFLRFTFSLDFFESFLIFLWVGCGLKLPIHGEFSEKVHVSTL